MDPSVIKGLFEQGVRNSLPPSPCRYILLTFVAAHGHRNKRRAWRRRILVHCRNNCHRRARQSRPFSICFVRCSQYTRKHGDPQIRHASTTGEVVASACRVKGSLPVRVWSSTRFPDMFYSLAAFVCQSRPPVQTRLLSKRVPRRMGTIGSSMDPKCGSQTLMKPKCSSSLPMCARHAFLKGSSS